LPEFRSLVGKIEHCKFTAIFFCNFVVCFGGLDFIVEVFGEDVAPVDNQSRAPFFDSIVPVDTFVF
jgi:hypothetical protein